MNLSKEQKLSVLSTLIFFGIFTGLLLIFGFSIPYPPPQEEGILINFGTDETGSGLIEPAPASQPEESAAEPVEETASEPVKPDESKDEAVTQDYEETAALEEKKRKEKERQEETERKKVEEERKKQEEIERKHQEEERIKKEQQQQAINDRMANAFGGQNPNGDNTGEGEGNGTGNQGSPNGDVNSTNRTGGSHGGNGVGFDLTGRSSRLLPPPPKIHTTEGKVVVEVIVDQNGNVVSARPGVKGTTISDQSLFKVAQEAALKAKFNVSKDAPAQQKGTITYSFGFE